MTTRRNILFFLSILIGFSIAFALLLSITVGMPLVGDLLTTNPAIDIVQQNEEFRQTTVAMGSFWFWIGVAIIGTFFTAEIWKWMRG